MHLKNTLEKKSLTFPLQSTTNGVACQDMYRYHTLSMDNKPSDLFPTCTAMVDLYIIEETASGTLYDLRIYPPSPIIVCSSANIPVSISVFVNALQKFVFLPTSPVTTKEWSILI